MDSSFRMPGEAVGFLCNEGHIYSTIDDKIAINTPGKTVLYSDFKNTHLIPSTNSYYSGTSK